MQKFWKRHKSFVNSQKMLNVKQKANLKKIADMVNITTKSKAENEIKNLYSGTKKTGKCTFALLS